MIHPVVLSYVLRKSGVDFHVEDTADVPSVYVEQMLQSTLDEYMLPRGNGFYLAFNHVAYFIAEELEDRVTNDAPESCHLRWLFEEDERSSLTDAPFLDALKKHYGEIYAFEKKHGEFFYAFSFEDEDNKYVENLPRVIANQLVNSLAWHRFNLNMPDPLITRHHGSNDRFPLFAYITMEMILSAYDVSSDEEADMWVEYMDLAYRFNEKIDQLVELAGGSPWPKAQRI